MNAQDVAISYPIVVGIDFGAQSECALLEAIRLGARQTGAVIHAVHVLTEVPEHSRRSRTLARTEELLGSVPERLRAWTREKAQQSADGASADLVIHVRVGSPAEVLCQVAVDVDASLIVAGTRGRAGLAKLVLGSVTQKLVETAHCPVLIARPKDYSGIERSPVVDPLCADCAKVRAATEGATLWCEYHSRPQIRPHVYSYRENLGVGPHDPGIVPSQT